MCDMGRTHTLLARKANRSPAWAHITIPDDVQVMDFLDKCLEAGRLVLEKKIVSLRAAASASLNLEPEKVDAAFARNCTDLRVAGVCECAFCAREVCDNRAPPR